MLIIILKVYCLLNVFCFCCLTFNCVLVFDRIEKTSSFEDYCNKYDKTAKREDYLLVKNSTIAEIALGNFVLSLFSPIMAPAIIIGFFRRILAFLTNR